MRRRGFFLKIAASVLSAVIIAGLLLFGDSIPRWLGREEVPATVGQTETGTEASENTSDSGQSDSDEKYAAADETEPETENESETEIESETEPETENEPSAGSEPETAEETGAVEPEPETEEESKQEPKGSSELPEGAENPWITALVESAVVSEEEMEDLVSVLLKSGELQANDGTGNIRDEQITYRMEQMYLDGDGSLTTDSSGTLKEGFYSGEFTLTDDWDRQAQCTMIIVVSDEINGPLLTLNTRSVTLKVGEEFRYMYYVEKAEDPDDGNLNGRIQLEGAVDTSVPGQYVIRYFARNLSGVRSPRASLIVTVE